MMHPDTYAAYLESVVLSLLAERPGMRSIPPNADIEMLDTDNPSLDGSTVSPINLREEMDKQRAARPNRKKQSCPCTYGDPCSPTCSCFNSAMSGGCNRCCSYGNEGQRRSAARRLIEQQEDAHKYKKLSK